MNAINKQIKELMEAGCEYDEAVRLVEGGVRIQRIEAKKDKRSEEKRDTRRSPRAQK